MGANPGKNVIQTRQNLGAIMLQDIVGFVQTNTNNQYPTKQIILDKERSRRGVRKYQRKSWLCHFTHTWKLSFNSQGLQWPKKEPKWMCKKIGSKCNIKFP